MVLKNMQNLSEHGKKGHCRIHVGAMTQTIAEQKK